MSNLWKCKRLNPFKTDKIDVLKCFVKLECFKNCNSAFLSFKLDLGSSYPTPARKRFLHERVHPSTTLYFMVIKCAPLLLLQAFHFSRDLHSSPKFQIPPHNMWATQLMTPKIDEHRIWSADPDMTSPKRVSIFIFLNGHQKIPVTGCQAPVSTIYHWLLKSNFHS